MAQTLTKSTLVFEKLKTVSELVDDMAGELAPAIEALDGKKREKTTLTNNLRDTILEELPRSVVGDFLDDKVTAYFEQDFEITDEGAAIRQVIQYADTYKEITGVDIIASLLSVKIGGVKGRVLSAPREFGLVAKTDEDGIVTWNSAGMKIELAKKVRVARDLS